MAIFTCKACGCEFKSKHSVAKYCSRLCANRVSTRKQVGKLSRGTPKIADELVFKELIDLAERLGRTPKKREFKYTQILRSRFGSYNAGVVAAGLMPNTRLPAKYFEPNGSRRIVPAKLRFEVLKRDNFTCRYCGGKPEDGYALHVDHIIPYSKGGETKMDNLITACWLCNEGKGSDSL